MPHAQPLGRLFDIGLGVAPLDLQTARTGLRQSLINCDGVLVVIVRSANTSRRKRRRSTTMRRGCA